MFLINLDKKASKKSLVFLWFLVIFGYFMFVTNWFIIDNVSGNYSYDGYEFNGWSDSFFFKDPGSLARSATNWTITMMRGAGSILAGWLIGKFGHKKAVLTVLAMMVLSFPFVIIATPFDGNNLTLIGEKINNDEIGTSNSILGYSLFVIFRTLLAIAGTTLPTYAQPLISKMNNNVKNKFNALSILGFNFAIFMSCILFVPNQQFAQLLTKYWNVLVCILIGIIFILFVVYLFFGRNISLLENINLLNQKEFENPEKIGLKYVIKQKNTWCFGILFGCFLIPALFSMSGILKSIIEESPTNLNILVEFNKQNNENFSSINKISDYTWIWNTWKILFAMGIIAGFFIISPFGNTKFNRKKYLIFCLVVGYLSMFIAIILLYFLGYKNTVTLSMSLVMIFVSGMFLWGIEPIILVAPHQIENGNSKNIGPMFGCIWGIGYMIYTFSDVLISLLNDIGKNDIFAIIAEKPNYTILSRNSEISGHIISIFTYLILCTFIFGSIAIMPILGRTNSQGQFVPFSEKWKLYKWNFYNDKYKIKTENI